MFPTPIARQATHHLITLLRSPHGLPERTHQTLQTLGLHKLHQTVLYPFSPAVAGKLLAVKELIKVKNVTQAEGEMMVQRQRHRGEGGGLEVTGRAYGGGKGLEGRA
jgi:ribosomal protein L30